MIENVERLASNMREEEARISARLGRPVERCEILDIGPGQRSPYLYYYGAANRYVGIDIEPRQSGNLFADFARDLRRHGSIRAIKTFGRRALGIDRAFDREIVRRLGRGRPKGEILIMDAGRMTFEDERFDLIVSTSVFEHLPDPESVMREAARVLRPGGIAHVLTHIYTSESGAHDTRIFAGRRDGIPFWAHLRPEHAHKIRPNSYLNERRLDTYRTAFDRIMPGCEHLLFQETSEDIRMEVVRLREAGELAQYSEEELLTNVLCTIWRKPAPAAATRP
jgi:SAM-dependent methyltransferase